MTIRRDGRTQIHMRVVLDRAIRYNAACLGEAPDIGVHYLKDGRVRVYDLESGWRRRPYREYRSIARAYEGAIQAVVDSRRVRALVRAGVPRDSAIPQVTERRRHMTWPYTEVLRIEASA